MHIDPPGKNLSRTVTISLIYAAVGALIVSGLVWYFGAAIGFVLVPVAVIGFGGYRMHLRRLARTTDQIAEASRIHLATVEALATAIDARDQMIGVGHVRRTQIYAVGLARLLGLPATDIEALQTAALLHDIGKLAVPERILNKPGKLTQAELEKAKVHSVVGASILENVGFQHPVVPTIRHHHEAWMGGGYPDGLKGEEIPLTARILSVADAFDTLRGARPYREAMPRSEAIRTIQAEAGARFDPTVVKTLLRNLVALEEEINAAGLSYEDESLEETAGTADFVRQIKRADREVLSPAELAREFGGSLDLNETLEIFARKVREFVPFSTCAVYLVDGSQKSAAAAHAEGEHAELLMLGRVSMGQGATGFALQQRRAVHNVDPDLDFTYCVPELLTIYETMLSVPLVAEERLIGAISLYSRDLEEYGDEHIRLLDTITGVAAEAIAKTLKHDEEQAHVMIDPMTGLPNERNLKIQFEKEAGRARRNSTNLQLVMLDLDGFKTINDTHGHKNGDRLLCDVGRVIRGQLRDYDLLGRYGGDEFIALVPDITAQEVAALCDRIQKAVGDYRLEVAENETAAVSVSIRAASYPESGETFDQIVAAAGEVMSERKTERKADDPHHSDIFAPLLLEPILNAAPEYEGPAVELAEPAVELTEPDDQELIVELDETHVVAPVH